MLGMHASIFSCSLVSCCQHAYSGGLNMQQHDFSLGFFTGL